MEQSFFKGFVVRAQEFGLSHKQANEMLKSAADISSSNFMNSDGSFKLPGRPGIPFGKDSPVSAIRAVKAPPSGNGMAEGFQIPSGAQAVFNKHKPEIQQFAQTHYNGAQKHLEHFGVTPSKLVEYSDKYLPNSMSTPIRGLYDKYNNLENSPYLKKIVHPAYLQMKETPEEMKAFNIGAGLMPREAQNNVLMDMGEKILDTPQAGAGMLATGASVANAAMKPLASYLPRAAGFMSKAAPIVNMGAKGLGALGTATSMALELPDIRRQGINPYIDKYTAALSDESPLALANSGLQGMSHPIASIGGAGKAIADIAKLKWQNAFASPSSSGVPLKAAPTSQPIARDPNFMAQLKAYSDHQLRPLSAGASMLNSVKSMAEPTQRQALQRAHSPDAVSVDTHGYPDMGKPITPTDASAPLPMSPLREHFQRWTGDRFNPTLATAPNTSFSTNPDLKTIQEYANSSYKGALPVKALDNLQNLSLRQSTNPQNTRDQINHTLERAQQGFSFYRPNMTDALEGLKLPEDHLPTLTDSRPVTGFRNSAAPQLR